MYDIFADTYDTACQVIGAPPQSAIGDKGLSISRVFEQCTRNGTAAVFPWRPTGVQPQRQDRDTHDRHGIARCKHCGGPTEHVRFSAAGTTPRIWARCMIGATPDCAREFTIPCSLDWRLLIRLPRTHPLYHELKHSHESFEAVHDWHRDRYKVAADSLGNRPKVCSMGFHQLRANIACLLDWLRICDREGWLGSARRNHRGVRRRSEHVGVAVAHSLARMRARMGLAAPYGLKAAELGIGEETPPSRRPRGAPPG